MAAAGLMLATAAPAAAADERDGWQMRVALYGFLPDLHGESRFSGADEIDVEFKDLLKKTEFSFMGVAEVRRNRVGAFADVIYFDLGNKVRDTTRLNIGPGVPLPPGITADLSLDVKSWIVTMAAEYRVHRSDAASFDLFAGARMSQTKPKLKYAFSQDFGPSADRFAKGPSNPRQRIGTASPEPKGASISAPRMNGSCSAMPTPARGIPNSPGRFSPPEAAVSAGSIRFWAGGG